MSINDGAELDNRINADFPTNGTKAILASKVRTFLLDVGNFFKARCFSGGASTTDPTTPLYHERSNGNSAGPQLGMHVKIKGDFDADGIPIAAIFDAENTGSNVAIGGHIPAFVGRFKDTPNGKIPGYGGELKVIDYGGVNKNMSGYALYDRRCDTAEPGYVTLWGGNAQFHKNDGTGPDNVGATVDNEGGVIHFSAMDSGIGGDITKIFALMGRVGAKILTGGKITSYGADSELSAEATIGGRKMSIRHNDNGGIIEQTDPDQDLGIWAGRFCIIEDGLGLLPRTQGIFLGMDGYRWKASLTNINMDHKDPLPNETANSSLFYFNAAGKPCYKGTDNIEHELAVVS